MLKETYLKARLYFHLYFIYKSIDNCIKNNNDDKNKFIALSYFIDAGGFNEHIFITDNKFVCNSYIHDEFVKENNRILLETYQSFINIQLSKCRLFLNEKIHIFNNNFDDSVACFLTKCHNCVLLYLGKRHEYMKTEFSNEQTSLSEKYNKKSSDLLEQYTIEYINEFKKYIKFDIDFNELDNVKSVLIENEHYHVFKSMQEIFNQVENI